ncbi:MAG TPA: hypothetical protein VK550_00170 [Polyangiaceae bacterium]|nr:hypothetical protein [Polyangiaceae bacterium]
MAPPATPPLIDETAQGLEKLGGSMNLVEDDQAILIAAQEQRCVAQFGAVLTHFEVEIERLRLAGDLERERRFAHLTRPQQRHGCLPVEHLEPSEGRGAGSSSMQIKRIKFDLQGSVRWPRSHRSL